MSPCYLTRRYPGKWVTLVNWVFIWGSPQLFVALIQRFQCVFHNSKEGPLPVLAEVPLIRPYYGKWRHMPQGTSNARRVATLAGLEPFQDQWVTACENGQATPTKELAADLPDGRLRLKPRR